jgi:hypothetical protein
VVTLTIGLQVGGYFLRAERRAFLNADMVLQEKLHIHADHMRDGGLGAGIVHVEPVQTPVLFLLKPHVPQFHR